MKSMIKNQQSFYVIQKIYNKLSIDEDKELMRQLIEKNLCYVNEKSTKQKC